MSKSTKVKEIDQGNGQMVEGNDESNGKILLTRAQNMVLVLDTPKGRGVFASKDIPAKSMLEVCPVIVLDPTENSEHISKTDLYNYTYDWPYTPPAQTESREDMSPKPQVATTQAVVFGLGSMFNHSTMHHNVGWDRDLKNLLVTYTALRDINAGEELCISYGDCLTFKDADQTKIDAEKDPDDWTDVLNIIDFID